MELNEEIGFFQRHLYLSVLTILLFYLLGLLLSNLITSIFNIGYPIAFIIDFGILAILWFIILPFCTRLPNKHKTYKQYLSDIQLTQFKPIGLNIFLGFLIALIFIFCFIITMLLTGYFIINFEYILPPSSWTLLIAITPGLFEEIAARGFMLKSINKKYKETNAIILSAIIFGIAHGVNIFFGAYFLDVLAQIAYAFFGGLALGYLFIKTKSLLPGIILHYLMDAIGPLFLYPFFEPGVDIILRFFAMILGVGLFPSLTSIVVIMIIFKLYKAGNTNSNALEN